MTEHEPEHHPPVPLEEHDPASVTDVPAGPPTVAPVVGQPWQPELPKDNPLD